MRLYHLSRLGDHRLWGQPLSGDNMPADDELYRPVELGWQVMVTRFAIWDLKSGRKPHGADSTTSSLSILDHLLELREVRVLFHSSTNFTGPDASLLEILRRSIHSR